MKIKIMIDSASDLSSEQAREMGMLFVPLCVNFGEQEFFDGENLHPYEFYDKMISEKTIPLTSLINEYRWSEAFAKATADGSELIVITLSSNLSGTYKEAVNASKQFNNKVYVVDSLSATFGELGLAMYAQRLINNGLSTMEIVQKLEEKRKDICIFAAIDTLHYLKMGGRISSTSAFVGTVLSIKPLITVDDGKVKVIGKSVGNKMAYHSIKKLVNGVGGIDFDMPFSYIFSGNDKSNINKFIDSSKEIVKDNPFEVYQLGCTIGTHIGPGAVGIIFFKK